MGIIDPVSAAQSTTSAALASNTSGCLININQQIRARAWAGYSYLHFIYNNYIDLSAIMTELSASGYSATSGVTKPINYQNEKYIDIRW